MPCRLLADIGSECAINVNGRNVGLRNIPKAVGSVAARNRALSMFREGSSVSAMAQGWKQGGVQPATIVSYLIDSLRICDHSNDEVKRILAACGVDDLADVRPVLRDIIDNGDCSLRKLLDNVQQGGARGVWAQLNTAAAFNIIRLCVVDTCRRHALLSSLG